MCDKVSAVHNWPTPSEAGNLRSFLVLASYYRRYIHKFADIAAPLCNLTNKGISFVWDQFCELAFKQLKDALLCAPILKFPDFSSTAKPFQLYTEASATDIGAVPEQSGHVIKTHGSELRGQERAKRIAKNKTRDELLCVFYTSKRFRYMTS